MHVLERALFERQFAEFVRVHGERLVFVREALSDDDSRDGEQAHLQPHGQIRLPYSAARIEARLLSICGKSSTISIMSSFSA